MVDGGDSANDWMWRRHIFHPSTDVIIVVCGGNVSIGAIMMVGRRDHIMVHVAIVCRQSSNPSCGGSMWLDRYSFLKAVKLQCCNEVWLPQEVRPPALRLEGYGEEQEACEQGRQGDAAAGAGGAPLYPL